MQDPALVKNPYPLYAQMRAEGDLIWSEQLNMWLAPRHSSANAVLRAKTMGRIYDPKQPLDVWEIFNWLHSDSILDSEPPKHTRLRALVQKAFTPGRIAAMQPNVDELCAQLLDDAQAKLETHGSFDVLADYAEPLPVLVIADLLGVPRDMADDLRRWSQDIVKMYEFAPTAEHEKLAKQSAKDFVEYISTQAKSTGRSNYCSCRSGRAR